MVTLSGFFGGKAGHCVFRCIHDVLKIQAQSTGKAKGWAGSGFWRAISFVWHSDTTRGAENRPTLLAHVT